MKNFLNYNYNLFPSKIYYDNNERYFFVDDYKVYICEYDGNDIQKIVNISNTLFSEGFKINTILSNKHGKYISKFKNKNIILVRVNSIESDILEYSDILKFERKIDKLNLKEVNLINEWMNEIDLLEKELLEYNSEYSVIKESFDYCIGCAENAVQLYKMSETKQTVSLGHFNCSILNMKNYLNPLLLCNIDFNYEISNYIKNKFINNAVDYEELYMIINNNKTPERLFACLLYPSHYFYIVKKMLLGQENTNAQKHVMKYMENTKRYKDFLIFIKKQLKKNREIQLLDWINK